MDITLYNTLTRKKEPFSPHDEKTVKLYACGPTVYDFVHIGNLRAYIFEDILRRVLEYNGLRMKHIENITDVGHLVSDADEGEDKMMKALARENLAPKVSSLKHLAKKYKLAFQKDIKFLNILFPQKWTPATKYIPEMIAFIKKIQENGFAYETKLALYFDVSKYSEYTKLSQQKLSEKITAARQGVEADAEKKNPQDFALWFKLAGKNKNHIMHWHSPWGDGFPGWHIECSAMSVKELGDTIDIHCGGIDHIPVHHTNERAQNYAVFQKEVVRFWLHNEFLVLEKEKMAKSSGTFITLQDVINKGYDPLSYRYFCLNTHYRQKLKFSWEGLTAAQNALEKLRGIVREYDKPKIGCADYERRFLEAVNDDLNIPKALGILWELVQDKELPGSAKKQSILKFDEVLGLNLATAEKIIIPPIIRKLAKDRWQARENKDWSQADKLRQEIEKAGYSLEDEKQGYKIKKVK